MVQKTRVVRTRKNYGGESSPYWDFIRNRGTQRRPGSDEFVEPAEANPDTLQAPDELDEGTRHMAELVREALETLSPQQRKVVETMAEGRTFVETARLLKLSEGAMRAHLDRARKKIAAYVAQKAD